MLNLSSLDLENVGSVYHNLSTTELYEEAVRRDGRVKANFEEFAEQAGAEIAAVGTVI